MRSTWERAAAVAVDDLGLSPEQVTRVLEAWGRAPGGERPPRKLIWSAWSQHRAWLKQAAGISTPQPGSPRISEPRLSPKAEAEIRALEEERFGLRVVGADHG